MNRILRRNCMCYQIYTLSKKSFLLFYIVTLYYLAVGLTYTNIAVISVIETVITLISEIPTGVVADSWSRKRSLQISEVLKFLSITLMVVGHNFVFLCIAGAIWGFADSFQSGADQALLYEAFDNKEEYDNFLSKIYSRGYLASAFATLAATFLFSINIYLPLLISLCLVGISFLSISGFKEENLPQKHEKVSFISFNKEALKYLFHEPALINILMLTSLCTLAIMTINSYSQPLLLDKGMDLKILGALMLCYNLFMSVGSKVAKKFEAKLPYLQYGIAVVFGLCAVMAGISKLLFCILAFGVCRLANGMVWPLLTFKTNQLLKSEVRSTVMSYQNMGTSLLSIGIEPLVGIGLDNLGIGKLYTVFGSFCVTFASILFFWNLVLKNKAKKDDSTIKSA